MPNELTPWQAGWLESNGHTLDDLLTEREVVETGLLPGTLLSLRQSRSTGIFFGVQAPAHVAIGRKSIRYTPRQCFDWRTLHIQEHSKARTKSGVAS